MAGKKAINLMAEALDGVLAYGDSKAAESSPIPSTTRIDNLPAELVRPDPVQARRVLPEAIHVAFHEQRLTPVQALQELIRGTQLIARQHNRTFTNVAELLLDLNNESANEDDISVYTPEEQLVRDLVTLAATIRDDGQVNPITVVDVSQGITRLFRIETGERRYWASWLLREFLPGYAGDGTIPCVIVQSTASSAFRQARENTARTGLSAIAMARQAALLLLAIHDIPKPDYPVDNNFYRQALELDLRSKREYSTDILTAMGGIGRMHFSHYKALLQLSDEAMELADRYAVDEYRLRFVLNLPEQDHAEMLKQIITLNLSGKQIKAICEQRDDHNPSESAGGIPKLAFRLATMAKSLSNLSGEGFAQALYQQEKDWHIAGARLQMFKRVIAEAESFINGK